jgi:hypothetical protein
MSAASIRPWLGLSAAAAIALVTGASSAFAVPQTTAAPKATANASPYAAQIAELRSIRTVLEQADHDYQGHRAAAVKLITAAIHALRPPKATTGAHHQAHAGAGTANKGATPHAGAKSTGNSEPQAVSDAQLKQAMNALTVVQGQLASGSGNAATAAAAVQKAVQELQVALSIK